MSFREANTAGQHLGNQVRVGPNTKGTTSRGVPTAIARRSSDFALPTSSNPDGAANRTSGRKDSGSRSSGAPTVPTGRRKLAAVENPDGKANRR
jgi:hypothetical protein